MKDVTIKSERFLLRLLTKNDVNDRYLGWINASNHRKYISYSGRIRSVEEICSYVSQKAEDDFTLFLGIYLLEDQDHIGNIKYESIDFRCGTAVMGILIGEDKDKDKD